MNPRTSLRFALSAAVIGVLVYWIATHTYWTEQVVRVRPNGRALSDPFYAAEHLARSLGAHPSYERLWRLPAKRNAVVVAALWEWNLGSMQRAQLQHWVESGGRLVVNSSMLGHDSTFSGWSGVRRRYDKTPGKPKVKWKPGGCRDERQRGVGPWPATAVPTSYEVCGLYGESFLASKRVPVWQLSDAYGVQALRIKIGRGSVSVVNGEPFTFLQLLQGANATLFVAATQLHTGDRIYFLSDQNHASLLALAWRFGFPVIALLLGALVLALWRAAPRFGPALAAPERARRSLAEQIRGTGRFLLRTGDGRALHAATVRALFAAAARRISAFSSLSGSERISRLASATGFSSGALAAAVNDSGARRANELRSAIALLEAARREILRNNSRSTDGN